MNSKKTSDRIANLTSSSLLPFRMKKVSERELSESEVMAMFKDTKPRNPKYKLPYVLKKGCTFTLYRKNGSGSAVRSSDKPGQSIIYILEDNDIRVEIENCKIIKNESNIPVYEE